MHPASNAMIGPNPANIRLDIDVSMTSWRHLSSSSSKDIFKTSSRRLDEDKYILINHTSSEDVLVKTNIFVLSIYLQDNFKTSSRLLAKTSSRHSQDVFKTSLRRLQDLSQIRLEDIFKTFWRRIIKLNCFCQQVFEKYSTCL